MAGQWLDDPTGRYRKRWHDGSAWTAFVTDDGPASQDPLGPPVAPPSGQPAWSAVPFESDVPPPPPPSPYGQSGPYPAYGGGPGYFQQQRGTNGFAVASLVLGIIWCYFVGSILAVIFGHIAMSQIGSDGGQGKGLAIAGLVLGYIGIAVGAVAIVIAATN